MPKLKNVSAQRTRTLGTCAEPFILEGEKEQEQKCKSTPTKCINTRSQYINNQEIHFNTWHTKKSTLVGKHELFNMNYHYCIYLNRGCNCYLFRDLQCVITNLEQLLFKAAAS